MEKIRFTFADGSGGDEFFVLEETRINGSAYILVTDSEEEDAECLILKDCSKDEEAESRYEIVEDEREQDALLTIFEQLLEDVEIEK